MPVCSWILDCKCWLLSVPLVYWLLHVSLPWLESQSLFGKEGRCWEVPYLCNDPAGCLWCLLFSSHPLCPRMGEPRICCSLGTAGIGQWSEATPDLARRTAGPSEGCLFCKIRHLKKKSLRKIFANSSAGAFSVLQWFYLNTKLGEMRLSITQPSSSLYWEISQPHGKSILILLCISFQNEGNVWDVLIPASCLPLLMQVSGFKRLA